MARRLGGGLPRAVIAAVLVTATIAGLLAAWFVSGWSEVRAHQREVRSSPTAIAATRGADLASELRGELVGLLAREVDRPYFHYQSLFHDPRSSNAAWSVAPTPLAAGPEDPLVLGYFQLDAHGRVTTPTINDEVPALSEPKHLAENRVFRASVTTDLAPALAAPALVAAVDPLPAAVRYGKQQVGEQVAEQQANAPRPTANQQAQQVVRVNRNTYAQNAAPTQIYQAQQAQEPVPAPVPVPENPADAVTITVSPLEWHTLPFGGVPALVAVRNVHTPDGALQQGFVVDRANLTTWLATRAGDAVAELRADDTGGGPTEIAPGWRLAVSANPRELAGAEHDADAVAREFVVRFVAIGALAALAGALAVLLVVRAERLARERSQFAAAAAHELRTPLAGLQLYGDMLADGLGDPAKAADYARRMSEEAARLGRVVSNVLGFSQLERGNLSVEARAGALDAALRELATRAEPALDRAGCALELDVEAGVRARFDQDALARIVGNLLDNAEKYGRAAGDRTIRLSARRTTDAVVEVVIADRGPGVVPSARARLFRPFARGVSSDGPAGLGLGLALSRSLARAMGGDLVYQPAPSGGAAFVLRLNGTDVAERRVMEEDEVGGGRRGRGCSPLLGAPTISAPGSSDLFLLHGSALGNEPAVRFSSSWRPRGPARPCAPRARAGATTA